MAVSAALRACVDVGGTKVSVSLNPAGTRELLTPVREATVREGPPQALAWQIIRLVDAACARLGADPATVRQVGIAACGPFRMLDDGIAVAAPNLCGGLAASAGDAGRLPNDWLCAPLGGPLAARFGRVRVENDAVAALEAERRWGALQGQDHCAYVTWSTGVGVGLCVDGRALRGKNGNAGHAGHSFVGDDDPAAVCGCGNRGDLESLCGGGAMARRFGVPVAQWMGQAQAGDAQSLARVDAVCRSMGRLLFNLVATLDLARISVGGSVFLNHQALLLPRLRAALDGGLRPLTEGCTIVPAGLGEQVGDYGALALLDDEG